MSATLLTAFLLLPPTLSGSTSASCNTTATSITKPARPCQTSYPSSLQILNSLYPNTSYLAERFFMVSRHAELEVAMQVQFTALPANTTNTTCRLLLVVPPAPYVHINGTDPIFDVYAVARDAGAPATWSNYSAAANSTEEGTVLGSVNGTEQALERVRNGTGIVDVGELKCNETLTFQMGMQGERKEVNYWDFVDVPTGASPVQGWRVVHP